ncbi:MAG: hypothetical protein H0Z32_08230 [Bacillaceae bacterium]|nr:hypothetical protein [Bacillaceae bacterium]
MNGSNLTNQQNEVLIPACGTCEAGGLAIDTVCINNTYRVSLLQITEDPGNNETAFTYEFCSCGPPAISNLALELCPGTTFLRCEGGASCTDDPNQQFFLFPHVKIDEGVPEGQCAQFTLVYEGVNLPLSQITVGIKAGECGTGEGQDPCPTGSILGPCGAAPTPTPTPTPTTTPTPTPPPDFDRECIKVDKVYDWVFYSDQYENKNFIPDKNCREAVSKALECGDDVDIKCTPSKPEDVKCSVNIVQNGNPGLVEVVWTVPVLVTVLINGKKVCRFTVRTQFDDEIALCVPEGVTADHISCKATQVICINNNRILMGPDPFGPMVRVKVMLCKEIQVEVPVKLEVFARFCQPRSNDIVIPTPTAECNLDSIQFPPQCPDIFPGNNNNNND